MTHNEITDAIVKGTKLAIDRMLERERKENGYIVISKDGKVVKVNARDIK